MFLYMYHVLRSTCEQAVGLELGRERVVGPEGSDELYHARLFLHTLHKREEALYSSSTNYRVRSSRRVWRLSETLAVADATRVFSGLGRFGKEINLVAKALPKLLPELNGVGLDRGAVLAGQDGREE